MLVDGRTWILLLLILGAQKTSVVDPHHPDVDPNSDFLFDADPDPTFHPDGDPDPDPDPSFKKGSSP
jgi:hypothetical protein